MARRRKIPRYPPLVVELPPYLRARLLAAATVLGQKPHELVEDALAGRLDELDQERLELVDRLAAETLRRTEPGRKKK